MIDLLHRTRPRRVLVLRIGVSNDQMKRTHLPFVAHRTRLKIVRLKKLTHPALEVFVDGKRRILNRKMELACPFLYFIVGMFLHTFVPFGLLVFTLLILP